MTSPIISTQRLPRFIKRHPWISHFPEFETYQSAENYRGRVVSGLSGTSMAVPDIAACSKDKRCGNGFCPTCRRHLRIGLHDFCWSNELYNLSWLTATIRVRSWNLKPGDFAPFGLLRDHLAIENFKIKLKRLGGPPLLIVGSIESLFVTEANVSVGKPFHIHVLIHGRTKEQIEAAIQSCFPIESTKELPFPIEVKPVKPGKGNFFRALSYCLKSPVWKRSKASHADKGRKVWPKPNELFELAANYGRHGVSGRLILFGLRHSSGVFRFTTRFVGDELVDQRVKVNADA